METNDLVISLRYGHYKSDVYGRQILTSKDDSLTEMIITFTIETMTTY